MNRCIVKDDKLFVYMDLTRIPKTEFAQKYLHKYCHDTFNGDIVTAFREINKDGEFCIVFTPADYIALADILDSHLSYNLGQARMIINWVDCYVRVRDDMLVDWAIAYLEILEGAYAD